MGKMLEDLKHGLGEIKEFMDGDRTGYAVHIPDAINVKRIRGKLGLTQTAFADAYGLSLDSVKNWETGRRVPDKSALSARLPPETSARKRGSIMRPRNMKKELAFRPQGEERASSRPMGLQSSWRARLPSDRWRLERRDDQRSAFQYRTVFRRVPSVRTAGVPGITSAAVIGLPRICSVPGITAQPEFRDCQKNSLACVGAVGIRVITAALARTRRCLFGFAYCLRQAGSP